MFKLVIILLLFIIIISLFSALFFLVRDRGKSPTTVKALSWRIGLSLLLLAAIIFAFVMGWIQPNPNPLGLY